MTECKIREYYTKHIDIFETYADLIVYCTKLLENNSKEFATSPQRKLLMLFISSLIKDLGECSCCFKLGLLGVIPLVLKKIIETWRYILYYIAKEDEAELLYSGDKEYQKPQRKNLHEAVDLFIKKSKIHKLEDENEGFYKDLIKRLYENLCSFSHLDIIHLKISVLDDSSRINLTINPHVEVLNDYMLVFAVMLRTLLEIFAYILTIDDELFKEKYLKIVDITNNHDDYIKL